MTDRQANDPGEFSAVRPWPCPAKVDCIFYHSMSYPDGESVDGAWDIRGLFDQYIGNYPIAGKTLLDVGTASGFLAFEAERAQAKVTAIDALRGSEFDRIHFREALYHRDRPAHDAQMDAWLGTLKNGYWWSWHKYQSRVETIYVPLARLPYWTRRFDVVCAGAILEHLADPVTAVGNLALLAKEAVIIAFTPVIDAPSQFMETLTEWTNPEHSFTFWGLSSRLYERLFANVGFSVEMFPAKARSGGREYTRQTIVARRVSA
jgi:SAM-dependent methyltransferase